MSKLVIDLTDGADWLTKKASRITPAMRESARARMRELLAARSAERKAQDNLPPGLKLAWCADASPPDNSCPPANKGTGTSSGAKPLTRLQKAAAAVPIEYEKFVVPYSDSRHSGNTIDIPDESDIDSDMIDRMQEQMSSQQINRTDERIDRRIEEAARDYVNYSWEFDPPSDWQEQIYTDNNLEASDIQEEINQLVEAHSKDLTTDQIDAIKNSVSSDGLDGYDEALNTLPVGTGQLEDAIQNLRDAAETTIQEKETEYRDAEEESARQDYADNFSDFSPDEYNTIRSEEYHTFWENNPEVFPETQSSEDSEDSDSENVWATRAGQDVDSGDRVYNLQTPGAKYDIEASVKEGEYHGVPAKSVYIAFYDENGSTGQTDAGHGKELFDKVSTAISALVLKEQPDIVTFSAAASHDTGKNTKTVQSRADLYGALCRRAIKISPDYAAVKKPDSYGGASFAVYKKSREAEFKAASAGQTVVQLSFDIPDDFTEWEQLEPATDEELKLWDTEEFWADKIVSLGPDNKLPPGLKMAFCPTGEGGGQDNSCPPASAGTGAGTSDTIASIKAEKDTPPPPPKGAAYNPNVDVDANNDGVADYARVGIPANSNGDPPIQKLPHLTPEERAVEKEFAEAYEKDPEIMVKAFYDTVLREQDPPVFETDAAKGLYASWRGDSMSKEDMLVFRSTMNTPLHQTANAVAKAAMLKHLDTLKPGDEIMVTNGGCGAGKGWALEKENNVTAALEMKANSKAIWDSAGDQNSTENTWIQKEAEARGLVVNYMYVHADPEKRWADTKMGVVSRAIGKGRMVDAKVFADSYALGAKNFNGFYEHNKDNPSAKFTIVDATGKAPVVVNSMPKAALAVTSEKLHSFAIETLVARVDIGPHIRRGALMGERIWQ